MSSPDVEFEMKSMRTVQSSCVKGGGKVVLVRFIGDELTLCAGIVEYTDQDIGMNANEN